MLFVNVLGIVKLYNLSGAGLKKLIPLSNFTVLYLWFVYVVVGPTIAPDNFCENVVGLDWIQCEKIIGALLLSLELS